jgi:hypothetical protein
MAEGPLVSVQHRLSAARTLGTRAATAVRPLATSRPRCCPSVGRVCPSRPALSSRRSSWERLFGHFSTSPDAAVHFTMLRLRRAHHAGELLHPPLPSRFTVAAAPSHHPHPSSCAGTLGEAQNHHPTTALSAPTAVTGESFTPHTLVQSPPLAAMPHPSGHFPSVPEAREASYPVNPPRRR